MNFKLIVIIEVLIIVLGLGYGGYWLISNNSNRQEIIVLQNNISDLQQQNQQKEQEIDVLQIQNDKILNEKEQLEKENNDFELQLEQYKYIINRLNNEIEEKEEEISDLNLEIEFIEEELEELQPYSDRVQKAQFLSLSYPLLGDYQDYTMPISLEFNGLEGSVEPKTDSEIWQRAQNTYNWISDNYEYCGDKGLRIGNTFYQFQFFSPDELLMSDNARCGDCDDFATLFAGYMYASGVPEEDVWVVCGTVPSGGHCWNWIEIEDKIYRVDPVCSGKEQIFNFFGWTWDKQNTPFTDNYQNIDCFDEYTPQIKMNPSGYYQIE